jgi:hypothetical protein
MKSAVEPWAGDVIQASQGGNGMTQGEGSPTSAEAPGEQQTEIEVPQIIGGVEKVALLPLLAEIREFLFKLVQVFAPPTCIDFNGPSSPLGPGFYPPGGFLGCKLEVYDPSFSTAGCAVMGSPMVYTGPGAPPGPSLLIKQQPPFLGLDCGFGLVGSFPTTNYVEIQLVSYARPARLLACSGSAVVGMQIMTVPQKTPQTFTFTSPGGIDRVIVSAPSNEVLLLRLCF